MTENTLSKVILQQNKVSQSSSFCKEGIIMVPHKCGRGWSLHRASSDNTASHRSQWEESTWQSPHTRSPRPSAREHTRHYTHCMTICTSAHTLHRHIPNTLFLTICKAHTQTLSDTLSDTIYKSTQTIDVSLQTYNVVYLPEVSHGGGQRALSGDVCRITRVMIHLRAYNTIKSFCIACSWNNKHMRMSIQNTKNT